MDSSPFATLSPELRNNIYEMSLSIEHPINVREVRARGGRLGMQSRQYAFTIQCPRVMALTQTCRAIRAESTQLFYAINTFRLICHREQDASEALTAFAGIVGADNAKVLGCCIIDLGELSTGRYGRIQDAMIQLQRFLQQALPVHTKLSALCVYGKRSSILIEVDLNNMQESVEEEVVRIGEKSDRAVGRNQRTLYGLQQLLLFGLAPRA